ncbi:elongation of fatty acids protein 3-like [Neltuma alba]|uniref:elongation of fatty acids protein 3-like n=1 Tax=Neltuma alba TaxID=207710 RepID=UPI0010A338CE|nr:elongation of fatty acids protein 3-like [Prosopis alba]
MASPAVTHTLKYWLTEHPLILSFRWSPTELWFSTWSFIINAISAYIATATTLHAILTICRRRRPVPLGPIPAVHSLAMAIISFIIFLGMLLSADAEIRNTRWLWRRTRTTPFEWVLCFPLGIRPSGPVFFWSYAFYLSRFLHLFRTIFTILRHRKLSFFRLFNHSILLLTSFLWLEFSQSFQVSAILITTLVYSLVYGYRFWTEIGLPSKCFTFTVNCQMLLLGFTFVGHAGVLALHFLRGGCNGIGAWVFNAVMNAAILLLFLRFYGKAYGRRSVTVGSASWGGQDADKRATRSAESSKMEFGTHK